MMLGDDKERVQLLKQRCEIRRMSCMDRIRSVYSLAVRSVEDSSVVPQLLDMVETLDQLLSSFNAEDETLLQLLLDLELGNEYSKTEFVEMFELVSFIQMTVSQFMQSTISVHGDSQMLSNANKEDPQIDDHMVDDTHIASSHDSQSNNSDSLESSGFQVINSTRSPEILLPTFHGNIYEWISFRDRFVETVDRRTTLSDIEKLYYLVGCCEGVALETIQSIPVSDQNYKLAWSTLQERFDKPGLLAYSIIEKLLSAPRATSETSVELNKVLTVFDESLSLLESMKIPNLADFILFSIASRCLPTDSIKLFEAQLDNTFPTVQDLLRFMKLRMAILECIPREPTSKPTDSYKTTKGEPHESKTSLHTSMVTSSSLSHVSQPCKCCKGTHDLTSCSKFKGWSHELRNKWARDQRICFRCLHTGHWASICRSKIVCSLCSRCHHSLLHPVGPSERLGEESNLKEGQSDGATTSSLHTSVATSSSPSHVSQSCKCCKGTHDLTSCLKFKGWSHELRNKWARDQRICFRCLHTGHWASICRSKIVCSLCSRCHHSLLHPVGPSERLGEGSNLKEGQSDGATTSSLHTSVATSSSPSHISQSCKCCKGTHDLTSCLKFKGWSHELRNKWARDQRICFRCLHTGHWASICRSKIVCSLCSRCHHSLLHPVGPSERLEEGSNLKEGQSDGATTSSLHTSVVTSSNPSHVSQPCKCCEGTHDLSLCSKFKGWSHELRNKWARDQRICFRCLRSGHWAFVCKSRILCSQCSRWHHSLLHPVGPSERLGEGNKLKEGQSDGAITSSLLSQNTSSSVILGTALIHIPDNVGSLHTVRALIDSASQISAITSECTNRLGLRMRNWTAPVSGLGGVSVQNVLGIVNCQTQSRYSPDPVFNFEAWVFPSVAADMPRNPLSRSIADKYQHLALADPSFINPGAIDVLLGADLFAQIMNGKRMSVGDAFPVAFGTVFGWTVIGPVPNSTSNISVSCSVSLTTSVETLLEKFWAPEEPDVTPEDFTQKGQCEAIFRDGCTSDSSGRFCIPFLFRRALSDDTFNGSRVVAAKRFQHLEKKLTNDPCLRRLYCDFMSEYLALGNMSPATSIKNYFIPHHAVYCPADINPKIRVVFDVSAMSYFGLSLNDCLFPGPKLQPDVVDVLLLYRVHRFSFTIDISKMYRQVSISPSHRWYQHILWRSSPEHKLQAYEFNTIIYGINCAPYLATRLLHSIFELEYSDFLSLKEALLFQTYMDNICVGGDTLYEVLSLRGSRGLTLSEFIKHEFYLNGPPCLQLPSQQWDKDIPLKTADELPKFKVVASTALVIQEKECEWCERFSSYVQAIRITVHILCRFIVQCRKKTVEKGYLSRKELDQAALLIVHSSQQFHFGTLIYELSQERAASTRLLARIRSFIDSRNIILVCSQLSKSDLPDVQKYPVLLSKASHFSVLIIRHYHDITNHSGPQIVSSLICRQYRLLYIHTLIRTVISRYTTCVRITAKKPQPVMADLPSSRVTKYHPFVRVRVDAGPFLIKENLLQKARQFKMYLAVFVCFKVRTIHLEYVPDLSTEVFITALNRFVARRGLPTDLYSDCDTNFVGVDNLLRALVNDPACRDRLTTCVHCTWHFNLSGVPHFGGLWEATVSSSKTLLARIIREYIFTIEEFSTFLCRFDTILNSRPINLASSDLAELECLSPGHFLIGRPLFSVPKAEIPVDTRTLLQRWNLIKQCVQAFWHPWCTEYLQTLQVRSRWLNDALNIELDDMVVIKDTQIPPLKWRMGRVIEVLPGADKPVRIVRLRIATGIITHPVIKLVKLPTKL